GTELERSDAIGREPRLLLSDARRSSHPSTTAPATRTPRKTRTSGMDRASNKGVSMRLTIPQRPVVGAVRPSAWRARKTPSWIPLTHVGIEHRAPEGPGGNVPPGRAHPTHTCGPASY